MAALLAVVAMTVAVALNVSFLRFYSKSGLSGNDNKAVERPKGLAMGELDVLLHFFLAE